MAGLFAPIAAIVIGVVDPRAFRLFQLRGAIRGVSDASGIMQPARVDPSLTPHQTRGRLRDTEHRNYGEKADQRQKQPITARKHSRGASRSGHRFSPGQTSTKSNPTLRTVIVTG